MTSWPPDIGIKPYYADNATVIWCADCREILPLLSDSSVDMIWTDPPYGHNNNNNGDLAHRWEEALGIRKVREEDARPIANDGEEANPLVKSMFREASRLLKPG